MKDLIFIGIQGSGKGTQVKKLASEKEFNLIETGQLFRDLKEQKSELADRVRALIDAGELVDDTTVIEIVMAKLADAESDVPLVFDGFPRNALQVEALYDYFAKNNRDVLVIFIELSEKEALARLSKRAEIEGRADDTPEAIAKRIAIFNETTLPLISYMEEHGDVIRIDGSQNIEKVYQQIKDQC